MKENLLTFQDIKPGVQLVTLNIKVLYSDQKQRGEFANKFQDFLGSDKAHPKIFKLTDYIVAYRTECIIPEKRDSRPPLLLIFGNPASRSVYSEMFFSFEGDGREHRFWKTLRKTGILSFSPTTESEQMLNMGKLNQLKKKQLYALCYDSPFRIGLAVYYSMPSPGNELPWAGVAGLYRLFGRKALLKIAECEKARITRVIRDFVSADGAVITFQKDAYSAIKTSASPDYSLAEVKAGQLIGSCQSNPNIRLFCCPPTRLLHGQKSIVLLEDFVKQILRGS